MYLNNDFLNLFDSYSKQDIEDGEFYTLIKGDLKIYLSHFSKEIDMNDCDNDESVVSVFRDGLNILHYGGELGLVIDEIKKIL